MDKVFTIREYVHTRDLYEVCAPKKPPKKHRIILPKPKAYRGGLVTKINYHGNKVFDNYFKPLPTT